MKHFTLLFFLSFSCITFAQVITIPDTNFKNALVNTLCVDTDDNVAPDIDADLNDDGEIDQSEALAVRGLILNSQQINDLTGINYFSHLTTLFCYNNPLTSLDLSGLSDLRVLNCPSCQLSSLNISGLSNLLSLNCNNNQLSSLNLSGLSSLNSLNCSNNQLDSLNLSDPNNLSVLVCANNQLSSLDLSGLTSLAGLDCSHNQLSSLDISGLSSLNTIDCFNNQLNTLDVSNLSGLSKLYCLNNQLNSLYIKNGIDENIDFSNNPELSFICCDDSQIPSIESAASSNGLNNCIISSNCTVALEPVLPTEATNLNLFPNPAETTLYIPTDVQITQADIFDMKGALVRSVSVRNNQIEVQGLSSGAYFTRLYSDAKLYSAKFMVK